MVVYLQNKKSGSQWLSLRVRFGEKYEDIISYFSPNVKTEEVVAPIGQITVFFG